MTILKMLQAFLWILYEINISCACMVEGIQYEEGISLVTWKIFITDVSHDQYGGGTLSIQ